MMRWQDLKDDLDNMGERGNCMDCNVNCPPHRLARRVLALWQPCDQCDGRGEGPEQLLADGHAAFVAGQFKTMRLLCPHCGGTGVTPTDEWCPVTGEFRNRGLYDYLFGE